MSLLFDFIQIPDVQWVGLGLEGGCGGGSICLLHFLVCYYLYATLKINKNTIQKNKVYNLNIFCFICIFIIFIFIYLVGNL